MDRQGGESSSQNDPLSLGVSSTVSEGISSISQGLSFSSSSPVSHLRRTVHYTIMKQLLVDWHTGRESTAINYLGLWAAMVPVLLLSLSTKHHQSCTENGHLNTVRLSIGTAESRVLQLCTRGPLFEGSFLEMILENKEIGYVSHIMIPERRDLVVHPSIHVSQKQTIPQTELTHTVNTNATLSFN